jgi:hypothetical protein
VTGPNGAGDRTPAGVFARVRRDKQVANLLYGLLGYEDETNPAAAIDSLQRSARKTLQDCGPEYRRRVVLALQMLTGLVLDEAERARPAADVFYATNATDTPPTAENVDVVRDELTTYRLVVDP